MAFQKVNDLSMDGDLGPATAAALADPRTPDLVGGASTRIEVDLDEQAPDGTQVVLHGGRNAFVPGGADQPPIL